MIRSILDFLYKNKFTKKLVSVKNDIELEYQSREKSLIEEMDRKYLILKDAVEENHRNILEKSEKLEKEKRDLEDLESRIKDRRLELEKVNDELKIQIRLIEAKASPENIWTQAFSQGYSKAWDTMMPMMFSGLEKIREELRNQEIEASFPRIDLVVNQKLEELKNYSLIEVHKIELKRRECEAKILRTIDPMEKEKLNHYLQILSWILENRNGN